MMQFDERTHDDSAETACTAISKNCNVCTAGYSYLIQGYVALSILINNNNNKHVRVARDVAKGFRLRLVGCHVIRIIAVKIINKIILLIRNIIHYGT